MPVIHPPGPPESAPAPAEGALAVSGTDVAGILVAGGLDPDDLREGREYDAEGLYIHGPKRARPCLARMIPPTTDAPPAPPPTVAHAQARMKRERARDGLRRRERFLAAIRGEKVGRNRRAA